MRVEGEGGRSADNVRLRAEIVTFDRVIEQPRHPRRVHASHPSRTFVLNRIRSKLDEYRSKEIFPFF